MAKLIRNRAVESDDWVILQAASGIDVFPALRGRKVILPLSLFLLEEEEARLQLSEIGVWLDSHENIKHIAGRLNDLPLIALNFPVFSDGRPYSTAKKLRADLKFGGEIRAIGDVLRDQLCYLERCGFNSFAIRADQEPEECLSAFSDFSDTYTSTTLQDQPLFNRRT